MTNTPVTPVIEMKIGGVWTDITADCRLNSADSGGGVQIKRGIPNEGNVAEPTEVDFVLNNREGKYSPKNPYSPNFGLIGQNTPIRVALSRQKDVFNRTEADTWSRLPTWTDTENKQVLGERWCLTGGANRFDVTPGAATIASGTGHSIAAFGNYSDVDILCKVKVSNLTSEFGVIMRSKDVRVAVDGDFEAGLGSWAAAGGTSTLVTSTTQVHSGTTSALATVGGSPVTLTVRGGPATVAPGDVYRLRMWVRCSISTTVTGTLQWRDGTGTNISTSTVGVAATANTWTLIEVDGNAPDLAASVTYGPSITGSPANGTLLFLDDAEVLNLSEVAYYSAYITPGSPDTLRLGTVARGVAASVNQSRPTNVVAGDWYWFRAQMTGIRRRVKFWKDGNPEPGWEWRSYDTRLATTEANRPPNFGQVGLFAKDGSATVTFAEVTVSVWRAHAEITKFPQRFDLSRQDRWSPISARGVLQRLGQGRKALESPVTLHLQSYTTSRMWIPFEQLDQDSGQAGNRISNGPVCVAKNVTQGSVDSVGTFAAPGLVGCVSFDQDTSYLAARATIGATPGIWSFLTFFRVPSTTAASCLLYTVESSGSGRYIRVWYTAPSSILVEVLDGTGSVISSGSNLLYFGTEHPQGCWIAANLYVFDSGGGIVSWAWNYHRPGGTQFYTINGTYASSAGAFSGVKANGSVTLTAAGGVQFAQWFHYPGDFPFVDQNFARAAYAYIGEAAIPRFLRLLANAGEKGMTTGFTTSNSKAMGAQTPSKMLDLLMECAEVDDAVLMEERDDIGLNFFSREALYNQKPLELHIDSGFVSEPLDPSPDDFDIRNDVTVGRPGGGTARSVQLEGPYNVNDPEDDPDGVGTYDEGPELNLGTVDQLLPTANWRRSKGTLGDARYPVIRADLTASAYQASPSKTAELLAIDSGRIVSIWNNEIEYRWSKQSIQGYTEQIDQYVHLIDLVGTPGRIRDVGAVGRTTRLATRYQNTGATFASGTNTELTATRTVPGALWVQVKDSPKSFPLVIEAAGVQLRVRSTGRVLNSNPHFDAGISGYAADGTVTLYWDRYPDQYIVTPGWKLPGALRMTATGATTGGCVATSGVQAAVTAATDYQVSAFTMSNVALADVRVAVDWYAADGTTLLGSSLPTAIATGVYTWVHYAATVTSPASSAFARIRMRAVLANTNILWADDLRLMPVSSFSGSPQILTVEQTPVNGVTKSIPSGSAITVVDPWRVAY